MYPSDTEHSLPYLENDQGMAQQIQTFDWSVTPLGPLQEWPRSLLTTVDTLLDADYPVCLFWGSEYTFLFNDAFVLAFGDDTPNLHPDAAIVWPALWTTVKSELDAILNGRSAGRLDNVLIPIERGGLLQSAYWTLSFSRVKETGSVCGVVIALTETTPQVLTNDSLDQLHYSLEACDLGTWDLNPATLLFSCNEKTKEILGLSQVDNNSLQAALDEIITPPDQLAVQDAVQRALHPSSGGHYDITYSIVHPITGELRFIKSKGKAYFDRAGKPIRFAGTNQDITTEELSRRRKEKLQQLVENAKDFMAMVTIDGRITYMNTAGRSLVGLAVEQDLNGIVIRDFYSAEQFQVDQHVIVPALEKSGHWSGVVSVRHSQTAEEIPCYGNYALVYDTITGKVISRAVTFRDLRPELAARKDLEESEKRFRNLVQEAPVATAIYVGREMKIQWANDAMIKLWGKDKSVIEKTVREALPELEGQPFHGLLDQVYTSGNMYQATEDRADLVVDGLLQTFYFNFSYKPLRDTEGNVYGILNMAIDVTEQVKTKRRLEESEKNFRNLIMQAPIGICLLTGDDFRIELANDQYMELVGKSLDGYLYRPIWDLLPEAREQGFDDLLKQVKQTGTPYFGYEQEVILVRNNKPETLFINFVYEPLLNEDGNTHSILVVAIDITQQVTSRRLIKEAADRARLAVESAKLGTYEVDILTQKVISSPRFLDLFDADETAEHAEYISRVHPDDLPLRKAAHEKALQTGLLTYDCRIIRRDGTQNWLQIFGQYYFNEENQPVKIIGIVQDITHQKLADEEREKFLSISHYSRDFIGMCDMQMKTLFVNKAGVDMLGIEGNVLEASPWDCFFPEDHAYLNDHFYPMVKRDGHGEVEIRFRHFKTNQPIWVIYSVFIIHDSKGEPAVMATISRDITERKTMEAELERRVKERTAELERLNEELQQFTFVSSHDLKEPLRKIQLFAGLAQQEATLSDTSLVGHLEKIKQSANRMSGLLTDLLNYSILANPERVFEDVDLNEVIRDIEDDNELLIQEKNAVLRTNRLPILQGIPFQLKQLFYNLVNNALKFSRTDVPALIQIIAAELTSDEKRALQLPGDDTYFSIHVIDNGIGFRQEFAEKVFVAFQRLNDKNLYSGNGIGLSICKKIVENHKGKITVRSALDQGTVFTLILPRQQ
ncbi:PAS/PAC sensor signal transduction histidine kinase [Fibrisoma limi BUZ 3]|uniref:histidine kinase n=1 Tax=Fibrisoma limi BUZ 3 TaxID=1185876 RepID=I2GKM5_9BACT|nr:PAS domain S-box protein [Fibrisoma limi]CCH54451.1 PAS/PAC sensor signal transduction histidine kinase [Fibrisoma limi BUZ 3]